MEVCECRRVSGQCFVPPERLLFGLQSSSHQLGQLGCFLPSQCWFVRAGITEAKNSTLGGKEHNVLSLCGFCTCFPNVIKNVMRIVG